MKKLVTIGIITLALVIPVASGCTGSPDQDEQSIQYAEVKLGELATTINGNGNIEAAEEANLGFPSGGRLAFIPVTEGDAVVKGQVLARLDTSALELTRNQSRLAVTQANLALVQAEQSIETAEYTLETTQDSQSTLELAVLNAEINLKQANINLDTAKDTYSWPTLEIAENDLEGAETYLLFAERKRTEATTNAENDRWEAAVANAQENLRVYQNRLDEQLERNEKPEVIVARLRVNSAEQAYTQAQDNLVKLSKNISINELQLASATTALAQAEEAVSLATQSLGESDKQLTEATITAPFDGIVAGVNYKVDDILPSSSFSSTAVIHLVNPATMQLVVELDEIDLPSLEDGLDVLISIDALPDLLINGSIESIYPIPTNIGGVVLYKVKIGFIPPGSSALMIGMSAEADIVIQRIFDVLTIPSRAIFENENGDTVVNVIVGEEIEERLVTTGISTSNTTEITSGLAEGETVVTRQIK
ncbi:efflux RND transporter periplasmic adaptor subunit [Chloroflexota bacterium]